MFKKLISYIKEALEKMRGSKDVKSTISKEDVLTISDAMTDAIDKWKNMYMDNPEWKNEDEGIYSMNISASICSELAMYVLNEMNSHIVESGVLESEKAHDESNDNIDVMSSRATFLDDIYNRRLLKNLDEVLEKAMAVGGVIIKPYISNNTIYFDFCYQGEFYPIAFDDDGNITDIIFVDQFVTKNKKYSKLERQIYNDGTVNVTNKAYVTKFNPNADSEELGTEIPLTEVDKWALISPEETIENVEKALYGYYRVPLANNVDMKSPLGVSVFSRAVDMIKRADCQFSRLDWEYEGGQMAIDVDPTAIISEQSYYGTALKQDQVKNRIYRKIDLGSDETYNAFAPSLRDGSYMMGLNKYLMRIEDIVCIARGSLSEVNAEARTATEIKTLKQRTFSVVDKHQQELQKALEDSIYAMNVLAELYAEELSTPDGEYVTNTEWSDSILVDTATELAQRISLLDKSIMSKTEIRMWYTGEDESTAQASIDKIQDDSMNQMMDLFNAQNGESTLEDNGKDDIADNMEDEGAEA